ncbi:MAG: tRNA glutamyl-Q(34) synthetase GluQRS [Magnetovibrio sp.]|nr:tRNA glutamyl-Q(34) synthetase GluQRS [Magnetovibrio sp.]
MEKPALILTRFAPSPTGLLHIGHAYAAVFAEKIASHFGGHCLLRLENIDEGRCRQKFETAIYDDLAWLGFHWATPVRRQSEHMDDYQAALNQLSQMDLLYPCFCTRKDIKDATAAPHFGSHGPDGPLYPGTCRTLTPCQRQQKIESGRPYALRLNMKRAIQQAGPLFWKDLAQGTIQATPDIFGDVVLARKDTPTSYHLAVTVDDDLQAIRIVTRGSDLFQATHIHRLLQKLLGLRTPEYLHHKLMCDQNGQRLAKRNKATSLQSLRKSGHTPTDILIKFNQLVQVQLEEIV